ncbi:Orsellinic acid-like protein [Elsinoe fawcettii]|nr:Orsellinic acid-like protein [Elsinoe fawcettii]
MERCTVPITPANVHEILQYEPRFKVIICTTHKAAIRGLAKHLNRHHVASSAHKKYIVDKYSQYEVVDPRNVPLPEPLGPAFGSLGRPLQAYICEEEECEELSVSRDRISKHCRQNHAWRWSRDAPEYWHTVWVQTFFKSGGFQKYFTVLFDGQGDDDQLGEDQVRGSGDEDSALVRQQVDLIEDMWREEVDKRKEALEVMEASAAKQDRTGWYHRTGWHDHLRNSNMRHLSRAGRLGDRTEEHLQRAARLVNDIVERAAIGLKSIHPDTRRWLRSAKPNEADVRPFNRLQNPESQLTYGRYFQRLVCYLLRVCEAKMREEKWQEEQRSKSARKSDDDSDVDGDCDDDNASGERSAGDDGEQQQKDSCEDMATKGRRCRMGDMYDAVRLCPWTKEQLAKAIRLLQAVKHDSRGQEECLLDLMESLICQPLYNDVHQSPLVHFLAILGIDDETNRLRSANDFSYVLAGIVWVTRLLFVERYLPAAKREEQGKREIDNFLERRQAFLTDGSYSPMSTMLSLLAYGKSIAMKFSNAGMIQWSPDKQTMSIGGRPILMNRFKAMIDKVIMQAETTLWYNLMWEDAGSSSRFEVPLEDIEDDVTFSKRGYSFVDNKTNGLTDGRTWMLEKMLKSVRGRSLWRKDYTWDIRRVKGYLQAVETFLRSLLFAVHVSGGQPARGPEITSLRFKNGFLQDRNVFIIHGQVVTVTRYHKSASQFDSPKVVPRFLPWRVGQLMALYIAYIQPFQELLSVHVFGARWSEYIWSDARGHWETDKMSRIISTETSKHLGVRLTTLTYRHSAAAIGREKVGAKFAKGYQEEIGEVEEQEADDDLEDEVELGAGRSTAVGQLRYGVSGDVIKHLSQRNMNTFRPMCQKEERRMRGLGANVSHYGGGPSTGFGNDSLRHITADEDFPVWSVTASLHATHDTGGGGDAGDKIGRNPTESSNPNISVQGTRISLHGTNDAINTITHAGLAIWSSP